MAYSAMPQRGQSGLQAVDGHFPLFPLLEFDMI